MASAQKTPVVTTLRMLVGAVVGALFFMAVALMFVLSFGPPAIWAVVVLLLVGVATYVASRGSGTASPISPNLDEQQTRDAAMTAFRSSLMTRLTLAESVAIIGIVLAFVGGRTVLLYDLGAAISILLLAVHVWPSVRTVDRIVVSSRPTAHAPGSARCWGSGIH